MDQANEDIAVAEQSVLGAMMLSRDARIDVPQTLTRDDFYRQKHQAIWDAILALVQRGEPADAVTVAAELDRRRLLQQIGGAPYLYTLLEVVPTAANAGYYAEEVRKQAYRRVVAGQGARLVQLADRAPDTEALEEHLADSYETCLNAAAEPGADPARPVGGDDALLEDFLQQLGTKPASAFSTGIPDLDRAMVAQSGALILLSADTGVGKSLLGAQIARHYARDRGERVLFHSLEMGRDEMVERDMSAVSGVRLSEITGTHALAPTDHDLITQEYLPAYRDWGTRLHYVEGRADVAEVTRQSQRLDHEHRDTGGIGLVVVDYLQIMKRPGGVSIERDDLALAAMTSALKDLARRLRCIVIAVSQFNNDGARSGTPKTYHLKGSSSLGQDADVVALMTDPGRDDEARTGEIDVHLPKVRKGQSGQTVTLAEQRHKAHFATMGTDSAARSTLSPEQRAVAGTPITS